MIVEVALSGGLVDSSHIDAEEHACEEDLEHVPEPSRKHSFFESDNLFLFRPLGLVGWREAFLLSLLLDLLSSNTRLLFGHELRVSLDGCDANQR